MLRSSIATLVAILMLSTVAVAQATGTHTTGSATAGKNEIHLQTGSANDVEIKEVRVYVPQTGGWQKIKPVCITPNPGGDNVIKLPADTSTGDKFQIDWKTTTSGGTPIQSEEFKKDEMECPAPVEE